MGLKVIKTFPDTSDFNYNYRQWNRQFIEQNIILNGSYSYLYYPEHWTTLSLKFAFGGNENYILDKMKYSVDDDHYLILNRDTIYKSLIDSPVAVETFTLNFTADFALDVFYSSFNNDEYLLDYPEVRDKYPFNFFQKLYLKDSVINFHVNLLRNSIKNNHYSVNGLNETLHHILEYIFRTQLTASKEAEAMTSKKRSTRIELFNRLNMAKDYISSNYSEHIDLNMLSKISSLCQHHFLRKFKSFYGVSPHQYLTSIRLEKAKSFLRNTDLSITEVCLSSGYESLSSFGMLFKKHYGLSPENFRLKHSKKVNFQII